EGHREAGRPVLGQVAVALIRLLGGRVAGVLAHRPEPVAVHPRVDAAGEGVRAGFAEPLLQSGLHVLLGVEALDLDPGIGDPALVVGPDDWGDVAVEVLLEGGLLLLGWGAVCLRALRALLGGLVLWPGGHGPQDR